MESPIQKHKEDNVRNWWFLFPVRGIDVTDDLPDLDSCIFGDATIVSRAHVKLLAEKWVEAHARNDSDRTGIPYLLTHFPSDEWHGQIVVRRIGILHTERERPGQTEMGLKAQIRAEEISALLSIASLCANNESPALLKHVQDTRDALTALDFDDGGFMLTGGGGHSYTIRDHRKVIRYTRRALLEFLQQEPLTVLTNSIVDYSYLGKTTRRAVCQSAMRISESLHTSRQSSQLLGAVTAIEILLQDQSEGYRVLERRLAALLGVSAETTFTIQEVLRSRHDYVHKGIDVTNHHVSAKAICLSVSALLVFAAVATQISSKVAVLRYLDMIALAEQQGEEVLNSLLNHARSIPSFPFLHHVDEIGMKLATLKKTESENATE